MRVALTGGARVIDAASRADASCGSIRDELLVLMGSDAAGPPNAIAEVIVFPASPDIACVKGQDFVVNGGIPALALADALEL
ncbi:MAG: hypothetical protein QNJ16_17720 [Rhodobacter sp.]|nr:hypothetical protein [Rhodobacter sp.]